MKSKLRIVVIIIVLGSIASIIYGFSIKLENLSRANAFIGGGTAGLFLVAMPLFLFNESKGKNMKDYMLTKENIQKMQSKEEKKSENQ
ncbi:hypothetical protein [Flagellimonas myxillae]|uniref:hypothetical protein n=1 Tax=Flagellimonas myxillae TaxID=2942214 RepID=UPI00201EFA78|nr:hypothetical protein [Muricauda myxillae]MCL6266864.1 hypothetical protein [Muricauda myxillae]